MLSKIPYDRHEKGYLWDGNSYLTREAARWARLDQYGDIVALARYVAEGFDLEARVLDAAELVVSGDAWLNDLLNDNVVAAVESARPGLCHFVRYLERTDYLICECEASVFLEPTVMAGEKPRRLCKHVLAVIFADWPRFGHMLDVL